MGVLDSNKITNQEIQAVYVQHNADRLTGTAQQNKAAFDALPELIAEKHNDLVDDLETSLSSIDSTLSGLDSDVDGKVDKVDGKGLSTNDYTTAEKTKLAGIASGAEVNVQSDWTQTTDTADDYIKNKPNIKTGVGDASIVEGDYTEANGYASHAEGGGARADGTYAHAEGGATSASGGKSHAEGDGSVASGMNSHAEGKYTVSYGTNSHAQNLGTKALSNNQTALGKYNVADTSGVYAEIVGNGTGDGARSNAYTLDWNGNGVFAGNVTDGNGNVLANKANSSDMTSALADKIDKVSGKGLSTNDYTTEEKTKLAGIESGADVNQNAFGAIKVGNDTATADAEEDTFELVAGDNISITLDTEHDKATITATGGTYTDATQSAHGLMTAADKTKLDGITAGATETELYTSGGENYIKVYDGTDTTQMGSATFVKRGQAGGVASLDSDTKVPLAQLPVDASLSGSSDNPIKNSAVKTALDGKVDKVEGKGLSANDFTDTLKTKLDSIAASYDTTNCEIVITL